MTETTPQAYTCSDCGLGLPDDCAACGTVLANPRYRSQFGMHRHEYHQWHDIREVPCILLGDLDGIGDPALSDEVHAEIQRRGDSYPDHMGKGHVVPGWGEIPLLGCNHMEKTYA